MVDRGTVEGLHCALRLRQVRQLHTSSTRAHADSPSNSPSRRRRTALGLLGGGCRSRGVQVDLCAEDATVGTEQLVQQGHVSVGG